MSTATRDGKRKPKPRVDDLGFSLAGLPACELWRPATPAGVRKQWDADPEAAWQQWAKELAGRKPVDSFGPAAEATCWGLDAESEEAAVVRAAAAVLGSRFDQVALLAAAEAFADAETPGADGPLSIGGALEAVAWAYACSAAAKPLGGELWWRVVDQLVARILSARGLDIEEDADAETILLHQLLAGEAALVLASQLPELHPLKPFRKEASGALSEGLLAVTDGEGLPPARCLPLLPLLLACWTRCRGVAEHHGKRCFDSAAETQYEWLVRQSLRLARPNGSPALTHCPAVEKGLWQSALRFGGDESDHTAAAQRLRPKPVAGSDDEAPTPAVDSEWSGLAVLASGWKPKAPRLTLAYEGDRMQLEIASGGDVLVSGHWPVAVRMEGTEIAVTGDWEQQCWFSDEDSDYLELAIELENGAKFERQIFLAHDLGLVYLAEIVLARTSEPGAIELTSRLPLAEGLALGVEKETREGWLLQGDRRLAGAVPLALPEWTVDPRPGEMTVADDQLSQSQVAIARNLCCPLLLDLKPNRFAKQRTWRQLTIAQQLEPVGPDVAVGYRYQSGKEQLVVYRSLAEPGNRTVIGQNTSSESMIGRFLPDGEVDEYFEIDPDED